MAMLPSNRTRSTGWVVFQGSEHRRFWRIFTGRGWRHCFLILPVYYPSPGLDAVRYFQLINPKTNFVASEVIFQDPDIFIAELQKQGATAIIQYSFDSIDFPNYVPRGFLTCVSLIKSFLGIQAFFVLTPKQLARWMLRNGGKLLKDLSDG